MPRQNAKQCNRNVPKSVEIAETTLEKTLSLESLPIVQYQHSSYTCISMDQSMFYDLV